MTVFSDYSTGTDHLSTTLMITMVPSAGARMGMTVKIE